MTTDCISLPFHFQQSINEGLTVGLSESIPHGQALGLDNRKILRYIINVMTLIFASIVLAIAQIVGFLAAGRLITGYIERKQAGLLLSLQAEREKLLKGEPCESATVLQSLAITLGREAGRSAKQALTGDLGHIGNAANGAMGEHQLELLGEQNPLAASLLGKMGRRGSSKLMANPFIQLLLQSFMGGGSHGAPGNGSVTSEYAYPGRRHRD